MSFEIKILGSTSAIPVLNRHHSAQLIIIEQNVFLVDCGESTQHQLFKYKVKINRIDAIFISHLHGDHYLGLVGLISTMHLQGRNRELQIFGPPGLDDIIVLQLKLSETFLNYKLTFTSLETDKNIVIFDSPKFTVSTIPLSHRISCSGFLFKEKPKKRRLIKEKLPAEISLADMAKLKSGEDIVEDNGQVKYENIHYTLPPKKIRSYAYCSDTRYDEDILSIIHRVDLLYHEATFLSDLQERARLTYHSTAKEAALIALKAEVGKLIIGHFSSRYKDLAPLLEESKAYFTSTYLAIEGATFEIADE